MDDHNEAVFAFQAIDFEQPLFGAEWRVAHSLEGLRAEVNAVAPNRSRANDGTIGDASHASRASRHNPNNAGVVCAMDITHDPLGGMDVHTLVRRLVSHPHPDLAYIISNRQVAKRSNDWKWAAYTGASPHDRHAHFAVGVGPDAEPRQPYDDAVLWGVKDSPVDPFPYGHRTLRVVFPRMRGEDVLWVQQQVNKLKTYPQDVTQHLNEDGVYGPNTSACIDVFQYRYRLAQDGVVGRETWTALRKETDNG